VAKFLVQYKSAVSAADQMAGATPEQTKAGMDAWMSWANRCGDAMVDTGSPLGAAKRLTAGTTADIDNQMRGFSILQAGSLDEAVKLLDGHPHFEMPGESSIEVSEFLSIPGM
jgi:YCII-related domain